MQCYGESICAIDDDRKVGSFELRTTIPTKGTRVKEGSGNWVIAISRKLAVADSQGGNKFSLSAIGSLIESVRGGSARGKRGEEIAKRGTRSPAIRIILAIFAVGHVSNPRRKIHFRDLGSQVFGV